MGCAVTPSLLATLRRLAEAALPVISWFDAEDLTRRLFSDYDAAFIAAANPATVLALVARVESLTTIVNAEVDHCELVRRELTAERDALREALRQQVERRALETKALEVQLQHLIEQIAKAKLLAQPAPIIIDRALLAPHAGEGGE